MSALSTASVAELDWVALPCVCANLRRLGRLATRFYDDALRPVDIEVGQFTLLATLRWLEVQTHGQLARGLGMEPSSLTRTLAILIERGWIQQGRAADARVRTFTLTPDGLTQYERASPVWRLAQKQFAAIVGDEQVQSLSRLIGEASIALRDRGPRARVVSEREPRRRPRRPSPRV